MKKFILPIAAGAFSALTLSAQNVWNGTTDSTWGTGSNWSLDPVVPGTGDAVQFSTDGNGNTVIDLGAGVSVDEIDFRTGAAAYTIGSGGVGNQTLTIESLLKLTSGNQDQIINADLVFDNTSGQAAIVNRDDNNDLIINGEISVTGGNIKFGSSTTFDDGRIIVNGGINATGANIVTAANASQVVQLLNDGSKTYDYNSLRVSQGTVQVDSSAALGSATAWLGGGNDDVTVGVINDANVTFSQNYRVGDLTTATATGGVIFESSGASQFVIAGTNATSGTPTVGRTITLGGDSTAANEVTGVIRDIGGTSAISVVKTGAGNWILDGNNTFTGTTNVSAGRLVLSDTSALYSGTIANYTESNITVASGATLTFNYSDSSWRTNTGIDNLEAVVDQLSLLGAGGFEAGSSFGIEVATGAESYLFSGEIGDTADGSLGFVKSGDGRLRINKNQSFTGDIIIEGGALELEGGNGGGLFLGNNDIAIGSGASLDLDKTAAYSIDGAISGAGSVNTLDTRTALITLTADNTYTGGTVIGTDGNLQLGNGGATGDLVSGVTVGTNANFSINRSGIFDFDEDISGAGSVSVAGVNDAVVTLSGTNTYSGGTTIAGSGTGGTPSTLKVVSDTALGTGAVTISGTGAQFEVGAAGLVISNDIFVDDSGSAKVVLFDNNTGTSTLSGNLDIQETGGTAFKFTVKGGVTNTLVVSGDISGTGDSGLSKNFGGSLVLSGTNTYDGATDINGGLVLINGDSSGATGAVTVDNISGSATLGGTGVIGGDVTIGVNGTLAPGASVESLEMGALAFNDGSSFDYEIDSTAGTGDLAVVNGDLSFDGVVTLLLSDLNPGTITLGDTFSLINYSGTWDGGYFTYDSSLLEDGGTFTFAGTTWEIDYDATTGGGNFSGDYISGSFVNIEAVPEPSAFALIAGLGAMAYLARRRR